MTREQLVLGSHAKGTDISPIKDAVQSQLIVHWDRSMEEAISLVVEPSKGDAGTLGTEEDEVTSGDIEVLRTYFRDMEEFQGKIRRHLIKGQLEAVCLFDTDLPSSFDCRLLCKGSAINCSSKKNKVSLALKEVAAGKDQSALKTEREMTSVHNDRLERLAKL